MSRKPFPLVVIIIISISFLTACARPSGTVTTSSLTDSPFLDTNPPPQSAVSSPASTTQILGRTAPAITRENNTLTASQDSNLSRLPLYFVENGGQSDPRVAYYVLGGSTQVYFTNDGVTFIFMQPDHTLPLGDLGDTSPQQWVVKLDFVGAKPVQPVGVVQTQAIVSYFKGTSNQWHAGLSTYSQIVYRNLWPGIDLVYNGQSGKLIYDFQVQPGADPAQIQLRYRGIVGASLNPEGQMIVSTPLGGFVDEAPVAWQVVNGKRTPVSASYNLDVDLLPEQGLSASMEQGGTNEGVIYGFTVDAYDRTQPLLIDPAVLIYCGYIGGLYDDEGFRIAVDSAGSIYVVGFTNSDENSFPVAVGPDLTYNGIYDLYDAFIAKVNSSGTALIYAGYIGGSGREYGLGIALDAEENAYITGITSSEKDSFPVTVGPGLIFNGSTDAFVAKVSASGDTLVYAGYIGGAGYDEAYSIAVDGTGSAYISGTAGTPQDNFPVKGGLNLILNGPTDAFVAKVSVTGDSLDYCGFIGGSDWEWGYGIAVDKVGNTYVTGETSSSEATFPVKVGPDLLWNGGYDAFIAKVNAAGSALDYAGYIGGSDTDIGRAIAVDGAGNAYITGETRSKQDSFPVIVGPDLTFNGDEDAFIAKVSASGEALVYAGYIGGYPGDVGYSIAVDSTNNAYVVGFTSSNQQSFPVTPGPLSTYNGGNLDAFVAKLNESGTRLIYAGYIGGSGIDYGFGIAVDGVGNVYVSGSTSSTQESFTVKVGPDLTYNGGVWDAFVAKVTLVPWSTYIPLTIK